MITRAEAKALADSSISDQRKYEIEELFHQRITEEASRARYTTIPADINATLTPQERVYAMQLLTGEPNLYTVTEFAPGSGPHEIIWS